MEFKLEKTLGIVGASFGLLFTIIGILFFQVFIRFTLINDADFYEVMPMFNIISIVVGCFSIFNILTILLILKVNETNYKLIGSLMIISAIIHLIIYLISFGLVPFGFILASGVILLSKQKPDDKVQIIE